MPVSGVCLKCGNRWSGTSEGAYGFVALGGCLKCRPWPPIKDVKKFVPKPAQDKDTSVGD